MSKLEELQTEYDALHDQLSAALAKREVLRGEAAKSIDALEA